MSGAAINGGWARRGRAGMAALAVGAMLGLAMLGLTAQGLAAQGQGRRKDAGGMAGYDRAARATVIHAAVVYVSANDDAGHVSEVLPGHEVVVMERNGDWVRVFANIDVKDEQSDADKPEFGAEETATPESGWVKDKGLVSPTTPDGAAILFGRAADLEDEATQPHAPKDAAEEAHLLYRRVAEYFPDSPLAAEAAYRSADVRWQIDRADMRTLPSAQEQEAYLRPQIYQGEMERVMKQYPGTKWAALAAWDELDNKLCGDWQGLPKCPEMESSLYVKYADRYPESPKAAEALYDATYRQGVLVAMYQSQDERKRSEQAAGAAQALAAEMKQRYPDSDFTARALDLAYRVKQGIAVYGSDRD